MVKFPILFSVVALFFSVLGSVRGQISDQLQIGGARIDIAYYPAPPDPLHRLARDWISTAARAVTVYYHQFPVQRVQIRVRLRPGHGILSGETFGYPSAHIEMAIGNRTEASEFTNDWTMTHEMVHLAFPSVAQQHHWIEEGIATYVEPIARAQLGTLSTETVWGELVDGLPKGEPKPGDRGLDFTPTWGRTYWGGALFCLMADIAIRRQTANQKGLQDALIGILRQGGTIESDSDLLRLLRIGDSVTSTTALEDLYRQMKDKPDPVDLNLLWKQLGVLSEGKNLHFDDRAPWSETRKRITMLQTAART